MIVRGHGEQSTSDVDGPSHCTRGDPDCGKRAGSGGQDADFGRQRTLMQRAKFLEPPSIGVPIANHDDNQHSFNENLRIQNLWDGIELMAALLTM